MVLAATSSNTERRRPELDELILGDPGQTSWSSRSRARQRSNSARPNARHCGMCGCGRSCSLEWLAERPYEVAVEVPAVTLRDFTEGVFCLAVGPARQFKLHKPFHVVFVVSELNG